MTDEPAVPPAFDVCCALPSGTTVLEASAGTGKTYTIAALTARYLAEGHAELSELMLVTFGRMATNELRLRVRERLVSVEQRLAEVLEGRSPAELVDPLERLLASGDPDEVGERRARIARGLADFDAATIATTHEFCAQMLGELGVLGDVDSSTVFVEQVSELTREVASDVYLRRYAVRDELPPMSPQEAQQLAQEVVADADARLVPAAADERSEAAERLAFAAEVRQEVARRRQRGRVFTYEDMLTRLRAALRHPVSGAAAVRRLRSRYRIVLVDEFQDTDPVQWDILRRAFLGHATLVLIGDPKQAIYAFRGADVFSYLDAVAEADRVATLATNWRSDAGLVQALGHLLGGAALGDQRIVVRPVDARHRPRLVDRAEPSSTTGLRVPVRVRVVPHDKDAERLRSVTVLRPLLARDLVADVTELLASGARLQLDGGDRPVSPADIAVLVRRNDRAEELRDALVDAGVPAVVLGVTSVYATSTAAQWLTLLTALEQPRPALVREVALTCFVGWSIDQLAAAGEDEITALTQQVRWWSRVVRTRGVAAVLETISADTHLTERILSRARGDRELTDLRHVAQSLHAAMTSGLGLGALVEWLRERRRHGQAAVPTEGLRRLETDAASVQILTVHRSKGLEFPIVYLPEAWDRHVNAKDSGGAVRLHEGTERVLDVGGVTGVGRSDRLAQWRREEDAEDLRLLYVALTRAQCQVVTWWAPSHNTAASALQRLLYGPRQPGAQPAASYEVTDDPLESTAPGPGIGLERVEPRAPVPWQPAPAPAPGLSVRTLDRPLDLEWRRTSYSALTSAVHGIDLTPAGVGSEVESTPAEDEAVPGEALAAAPPGGSDELARSSPMAGLPSGVAFGTVVHAVLERVDLQAADLPGELRRAVADQLSRTPPTGLTVEALTAGLLPALETPLGPLADGLRLADFTAADRLAELTFELPLSGGERATSVSPASEVRLGQLAPLLRAQLPRTDPLASYPGLLEHPLLTDQSLRGYLTGSIDAVLRVRQTDTPRYLVVDYKTNWLGSYESDELTLGHYTAPRLAEAMMAAHYPLQALLYSVAVHRFLRWRQPGYDPDQHLGGVLYLFVRGMAGPQTPVVDGVPCGVFSWRPPSRLVTELSDLLEGPVSAKEEPT